MSLRIGFDLDGVVADMESEFLHHARGLFGEGIVARCAETPETPVQEEGPQHSTMVQAGDGPQLPALTLTSRQERRLWRHVRAIDNFWETLREIEPGVLARLSTLARERGWEVIFLTKRPTTAGATAQVQSQRWLDSKGFNLPSVFVVQGSRGLIATALGLDVVVDDRPENCIDVVSDSSARAILIWRTERMDLPDSVRRLGIGTARSVNDALDILARADVPGDEDRPGMMARVKRLLGLGEPVGR